jgi:ubiquitin-conjugating enzyme E2 Q
VLILLLSRYLLVKSSGSYYASGSKEESNLKIPFVKLDPAFKLTIGGKQIQIPEPAVKLQRLLTSRKAEIESIADLHDEDDASVFNHGSFTQESGSSSKKPMVVSDDEDDEDDFDESWYDNAPGSSSKATGSSKNAVGKRPANDWQHDPEWVRKTVEHLIAPPNESSPMAIKAIQRELKAMLDEQAKAPNLKELGWYMPPEYVENNDNLFQWIVGMSVYLVQANLHSCPIELHSFDEELPIARDMKAK